MNKKVPELSTVSPLRIVNPEMAEFVNVMELKQVTRPVSMTIWVNPEGTACAPSATPSNITYTWSKKKNVKLTEVIWEGVNVQREGL